MRIGIALLILCFAAPTYAQSCTPSEKETLQKPTVSERVAKGKLFSFECAVAKVDGSETLVAYYVINAASGLVSHLASLPRKGFTVRSRFAVVSDVLGLDSFPVSVDGQKHLLFVIPGTTWVYMNSQTGLSTTKLARWVLGPKTLDEDKDHSWLIDAGQMPKIHQVGGRWKAELKGKTVDLN